MENDINICAQRGKNWVVFSFGPIFHTIRCIIQLPNLRIPKEVILFIKFNADKLYSHSNLTVPFYSLSRDVTESDINVITGYR